MERTFSRAVLPQKILAVLPLTLFFPVGIIYIGVLFFALSLILAGEYRAKWRNVKSSLMFCPIIGMTVVTCVIGVAGNRPQDGFWNGFAHYQIYLFLLLFISVGAGEWQRKAVNVFYIGAIYGATLFYLNMLGILPDVTPFKSYVNYAGNKSILLGILLAIAAAWMLYEMTVSEYPEERWKRIVAFIYVTVALLLLTKTRTAVLIFFLLSFLMLARQMVYVRRQILFMLVVLIFSGIVMQFSSTLLSRIEGTKNDLEAFTQGARVSGHGNRLEILTATSEMIRERPWLGHGIGNWATLYAERASWSHTAGMSTPHNEYLLYAAEMGVLGLAALLWIWVTQLLVARKMGGHHGMLLGMLGIALIVGGMFNAVLRDLVFGMPFMLLLAIPLAGVRRT